MQILGCSTVGAVVLAGVMLFSPALASETAVKIGVITCKSESGWRYALRPSNDLHCLFVRSDRPAVAFRASASDRDIDLGYVKGGERIWDVVAAEGISIRDLEGRYAPPTGQGAGRVATLVGGLGNRVTLQPSADGQASPDNAVDWLKLKQGL